MLRRISTLWLLMFGMLIYSAFSLCHAQDSGKLFDVTLPQAKMSSAVIPDIISTSPPEAAQVMSEKDGPGKHWFWRFLEGIVLGAARYNTEKEGDGRPYPGINTR
jgi:hypothetical protein